MSTLWAPFSSRASQTQAAGVSLDIPELRERVRVNGLPETYVVVGVDLATGVADLVAVHGGSSVLFDVPFSSIFRLEDQKKSASTLLAA